jgi:hypothetical protein
VKEIMDIEFEFTGNDETAQWLGETAVVNEARIGQVFIR